MDTFTLYCSATQDLNADRVLLLKDGNTDIVGAGLRLDQAAADRIIAQFRKHGTKLPIDYHHATLEVEESRQGKAPAAGWIKTLEYVPGEGLYGKDISWTDEARKEIAAQHFKYLSPVVVARVKNNALEMMHSVALTNRPRTRGMAELVHAADLASLVEGDTSMSKDKTKKVAAQEDLATEEGLGTAPMDPAVIAQIKLMQVLELPDETSLVDVLNAAIEKIGPGEGDGDGTGESSGESAATEAHMKSIAANLGCKVEEVAKEIDKMKVIAGTSNTLAKQVKLIQAQLNERDAADYKAKVEELIETQVVAGKILPDDEEVMAAARALAASDPDGFTVIYDGMPAIVAPGSVTNSTTGNRKVKGERGKIIAAAASEYEDVGTTQCKKQSWVNIDLDNAGLSLLTEEEIKAL